MNILLVDDDRMSRDATGGFLRDMGHAVTACENGKDALIAFGQGDYPMVLTDLRMPGMSGLDLLRDISRAPNSQFTDVVLFTGYGDLSSAIEALRAGAYDYVLKPFDADELAAIVERSAEHQSLLRENKHLTNGFSAVLESRTEDIRMELRQAQKILAHSSGIDQVGIFSPAMRDLTDEALALHNDPSLPVLIEGETGTGKEILARIIHYGDMEQAVNINGAFIDINCAAINPNLFESEIFGHEAGAYTSATSRGQKGKLDMAQGGTLFLDEIGELSPEVQAKLLRVLQEKQFYRVGGLKKISTNARIICATNVDLEKQVSRGRFRADLFYRLAVGRLRILPLRERPDEILPLAELFLLELSRQRRKRFLKIEEKAAKILRDYTWPGNVRELRNVIEMVVFKYDEQEVKPHHLLGMPSLEAPTASQGEHDIIALPFPPGGFSLKDYNTLLINQIVAAHNNNHSAAARYLGISRRTLSYRLEP